MSTKGDDSRKLAVDLTTPEGRTAALDAFDRYGWILGGPAWLIRRFYNAMSEHSVVTTEAQKNAAIDIIRAGKENNVDTMTIKLDHTAGIDLGGEVEGIPIKLKVGNSGTVEVSVTYQKMP